MSSFPIKGDNKSKISVYYSGFSRKVEPTECVCVCVCVCVYRHIQASQVMLLVMNPPANAGGLRDVGVIPRSERSPGAGHGNPLWYSCLENPMDRGAWWAMLLKLQKVKHD